MLDFERNIYRPIDFTKINYITGKDKSLLFELKNKFYIISSGMYKKNLVNIRHQHEYVAIIDVNSKKVLYLEDRKNNLYLDFFYPIANRIVPVVQVNKSGVHVHFLDLINGQINIASRSLDKIGQMIIDIVHKDKHLKYYRRMATVANLCTSLYIYNIASL